ncbi:MAG: Xylosidase/arabinosidase [Frondihabitans sp.]|nr:Xylosidase/arabinosidase [Frondihabitans sp.]
MSTTEPTVAHAYAVQPSTAKYPNPLIPGFNPDPSIVKTDDGYYIVTSTFEYLPGIPVYHSTDLVDWTRIGNVIERDSQLDLHGIATLAGVWAPTIRFHDGTFYVIVVVAGGPGCMVYRATDPAGPWSDATVLAGVEGIDPDLSWDDDGTTYVTFSGLATTGPNVGAHYGIQQVKVDLDAGTALEEPRSLWSGTGLKFPEAPHLYHLDEYWYLLIAEGGTERGHGVSIARGTSPEGPFESFPGNPFLSARSTNRPIQNTGHADLVETPDGGWALVLLGMRPRGGTQAFSALGRETFITTLTWEDGWPVAEPVLLDPRPGSTEYSLDFGGEGASLDGDWLGIRRHASDIARVEGGRLVIDGGPDLDAAEPAFIGRRQLNQTATATTTIDASQGIGGIAVRYDEVHHAEITVETIASGNRVIGRLRLAGITQEWSAELPPGEVELSISAQPTNATVFGPEMLSSDRIVLAASAAGRTVTLAELDGRYLTAETAGSFTGRVIGLFATAGTVSFADFRYQGSED